MSFANILIDAEDMGRAYIAVLAHSLQQQKTNHTDAMYERQDLW